MRSKKEEKNIQGNALNGSINLIGVGTSITGDISCKGDIRIDGEIRGNIISKSKVVIGVTGIVTGDIIGTQADVSGTLKGEVSVSEILYLKASAKVNGDINTNKLIVESGAVFTGNCNMGIDLDASGEEKSNESEQKRQELNPTTAS